MQSKSGGVVNTIQYREVIFMTIREKILKTFIVTIREINLHGGPEKFFEKYPVGGIYYGEGLIHKDETGKYLGSQLDVDTLNECRKYSKKKLLICADGVGMSETTKKIRIGRSIGSSRNLEDAYEWGKTLGMKFNNKGVDWILGPIIDMFFNPLTYLSALSDDPELTAMIYREVVRGIQDQGVCATVKHFPGLGTHYLNMHLAPGSNTMPFDEWMETYGYTYKEMFKENVMSVMTTHVTLKSYADESEDGFYPIATFSKKLTTDLLKNELGFEGAVVTDALCMGGNGTGDFVEETVQAFKAGADLLLWPAVEAAEVIEQQILSGEIPMSRLDDALARIERMESFRNKALEDKAFDTPDAKYIDEKVVEIAERGICLLKNKINLIPLAKDEYKNILIVDVANEDTKSAVLLKEELEKRGIKADIRRDIFEPSSQVCWQRDVEKVQKDYDLVIFNINAPFVATWNDAYMLIWASHHFDKKKKLIVNYSSPYFASEYFPEDPTYIEMNTSSTEDTVKMLVDRMFGEAEFTGNPVLKNTDCSRQK